MKRNLLSIALATLMLLPGMGVEAKKLHTIGDSTMDSYAGGGTDKMGWGGVLQQFFNGKDAQQNGITVNNRGKSGSSTRTFRTDTRFWATMVTGGSDAMQSGDILLIQFAHNDENNNGMDAVELQAYNAANGLAAITDLRGTKPTTTYKDNLRTYINEARAMGVKPILVSAMCRKYFTGATIRPSGRHNLKDGFSVLTESGVVDKQKLTTDDHSMDYTYQMEQVALEMGVPYIDMTAATATLFETLGETYCTANVFVSADNTHTTPMGATLVARCFAQALVATANAETDAAKKAVLDELAQYVSLSSDITLSPETMDFGSTYVGTPVVKSFNIAGFDITPEAGTYTVSATEGYEVSLDGESWAASIRPAYAGGSIFATVKVRGTTAAEGTMNGTLTVTCGSLSKTATLTMTGILNTSGTESQVVWNVAADGGVSPTTTGNLIAGEEVISGLILGGPAYQEIDGVKYRRYKMATWPNEMDEVSDRYIQFSAEVPEGMNFRFDGLSLDIAAIYTNNLRSRIYYATKADFTDAVQVKEFTSMGSSVVNHVAIMPMKNLTEGDHIYVRIYPWMQGSSEDGRYIAIKDVTIHGYAEGNAYAVGITRDIADGVVTSNNYMLDVTCPGLTVGSLLSTYNTLGYDPNKNFCYNGSETALTFSGNATLQYRNSVGNPQVTIKTQAGEADGAENHDAYVGFDLTVEQGKQMQIKEIKSVWYPGEKSNYFFEYVVENANGEQLYKSPAPLKVGSSKQPNSASNNLDYTVDVSTVKALQNLTGQVRVKFIWWVNSGSTVVILKDFQVTASVNNAAADEASPVFTTQPAAASEVMVNNPVKLTVAAEHYSSLTWYQASSATADPANDTELGKGDNYTFTSATPGTYYIYCRAYNEDATGEQYANSNMAVVTVQAVVYPLTLTWDFSANTDQDYFTNGFVIQNTTATVHSDVAGFDMTVDATASGAKLSTTGRTSNAQFNAGTILRIPVGSTNDIVKLTMYNGSTATLGGEVVNTSAEFTHRVVKAEAEAGYVEIVSGGGYLVKIQAVLQGDNAREDRNATVTYYDIDGTTVLGTQTLQAGQPIGTYAYTATIPEGYTDNGWVDVLGSAVPATQVVVADFAIYPYITKLENGKYIIPVGNGRQLYNTLKNAAEGSHFYLANGTYDLGNACRTELKSNCVLQGESRAGTKIVNWPLAPGIQATSTIRITGNNAMILSMTLRCEVSYATSLTHGVGVALEVNGDKSIVYDVDLQCNQDTYYSNGSADQRGYLKNCRIEGTVDYICGGGNIWFENTTLYCNQRYDGNSHAYNNNGDVIGAPATNVATAYGYVLSNCTIDGHSCQEGNYNLARPWQGSPAMTWLNTTCIRTPGANAYGKMTDGLKLRFHEYNTHKQDGTTITGHKLDGSNPGAGSDALYLTSVGDYTYQKVVMATDGWDPEGIISAYLNANPTGVEKKECMVHGAKCIVNGRLVIKRGNVLYDLNGRKL